MSRYLNIITNHIFEDTIIENHEFSTADIQWNRILELERGKGDHCHLDGMEVPYSFTGVEQLIEDFITTTGLSQRCH